MLITFPLTFLRYRKGLQNAEDQMKRMLQNPEFRRQYIEYQKLMQEQKNAQQKYVDADYFIIDDEDDDSVFELEEKEEDFDEVDDDTDEIFL